MYMQEQYYGLVLVLHVLGLALLSSKLITWPSTLVEYGKVCTSFLHASPKSLTYHIEKPGWP